MKKQLVLLPEAQHVLDQLGENVNIARLRRKLGAAQVSERMGISRGTLWQIETGTPTVAMGTYFQVLL